jgi:hypothetical protein
MQVCAPALAKFDNLTQPSRTYGGNRSICDSGSSGAETTLHIARTSLVVLSGLRYDSHFPMELRPVTVQRFFFL